MRDRESMRRSLARRPDAVIDVHTHVGISPDGYACGSHPYCLGVEDMLIRMEALDIDHSVVFPLSSFHYDIRSVMDGKVKCSSRIASFPYEIANRNLFREIFDLFADKADRFLPFCMFDPSRKQDRQVALFEELAETYPVYGLKTVTSYNQAWVTDLLKKAGRPILDFAAERDIPVLFHSSVFPGDPWANVFDILRIVEARPDIRFCIAHTARFDREALDAADALENCMVDLSAFHIHCQLAERDFPAVASPERRFDVDYAKPRKAMAAFAEAYPDTICWGTDTPAYSFVSTWTDENGESHDFRLLCEWNTEAEALRSLPKDVIRRIANTNTRKLLFG